MLKKLLLSTAAAVALVLAAGTAQASDVSLAIGFNGYPVSGSIYLGDAPRYYPPRVYYAPPPVVYEPYYAPRVVYRPAPVWVPPRVYYEPRHWQHHRHWDRDDNRRYSDRDRRRYRD